MTYRIIERNWNIRIPGFATDEIRPSRKPVVVDAHRQRLAAINAAKSARRTTDTLSGTNNQAS
jgi:transcription initiation factor TFIID subunit TAF12